MSSAVAKLLGGEAVLGKAARSNIELAHASRHGLPVGAVVSLWRAFQNIGEQPELSGFLAGIFAHHSAPQEGELLTPVESDLVVRAAWALARATDVLGDRTKAARWLVATNQALGGEKPIMFLDTAVGYREVEALLDRIEYGVYS